MIDRTPSSLMCYGGSLGLWVVTDIILAKSEVLLL